jgi:hypothetical protein
MSKVSIDFHEYIGTTLLLQPLRNVTFQASTYHDMLLKTQWRGANWGDDTQDMTGKSLGMTI